MMKGSMKMMRTTMTWMRKKKKRKTVTVAWKKRSQTREKRIERWGLVCVCVLCCTLCCCLRQHRGRASERQKSTQYIVKYINLSAINTTNTRDKH